MSANTSNPAASFSFRCLKSRWSEALAWLFALGAGLGLLSGRFDWSGEAFSFSLRSYFVSAYFFLVLCPTLHFILRTWLGRSRLATRITLAVGIILTLPYRWLGLSSLLFLSRHPVFFHNWREPGMPMPETNWFPGAFHSLPVIPLEGPFFASILALGCLCLWKWFPRRDRVRSFAIGVFILVVLQTWLHLSMRSPYTYLCHFEQPAANHYWYQDYLFEGARGAVNMDYPLYRQAELLFLGVTRVFDPILSRAFPMYLSSQFSAFFNSYYVWLTLNIAAWFATVLAMAALARELFDERVALFTGLVMASAQGVILYAAQPKVYVIAICETAWILVLQLRLLRVGRITPGAAAAFGAAFGLVMLSYESHPWVIALPLCAWALGIDRVWSVASVLFGVAIWKGFLVLCGHLPALASTPALDPVGGHPLDHIRNLLAEPKILLLLRLTWRTLTGYLDCMKHAFQLTVIPAMAGIFWVKLKRLRLYLLTILLPGFLTFGLMSYGQSFYTQFPRLVYSAYPAIYLCAGIALSNLGTRMRPTWAPWLGSALAWAFILVNFVYLNLDVWGFPGIYFEWFYRNGGYAWN